MKGHSNKLFRPLFLINKHEDIKVVLPYKDDNGNTCGESVLATKEGKYYRVKSIPMYASKVALYDVIEIYERNNVMYFHKIIHGSRRSVIQMTILDNQLKTIWRDLKKFGCKWQMGDKKHRIAFDIPENISFQPIKDWLDQGEERHIWCYRGACLSHN